MKFFEINFCNVLSFNSCYLERVSSKYKIVLDDKRLNMSEQSINSFYFYFTQYRFDDQEFSVIKS
ncbi:hypothetical protein BpHYR1_020161 [Brachionus plicatilis]|uniref:Uncharacterized protein n=1 Tax=Brachionus plicatilis TaxID=10195 RepID=A0A3M7PY24_BRAPC|nr:hypothetical protein BpHYR1_020161 [Brachionus plicatilis]